MTRTLSRVFLGLFVVMVLRTNIATAAVQVTPLMETGAAHNSGDTADDSAIWIHPTDPSQSTVIGDDKNGGMMVWNPDGTELQYLDASKRLNNVDIRYNFPLVGSYSTGQTHTRVALVVVGYENGNSLATYKVNPHTRRLESTGDVPLSINTPYGGCMYRSPVTGKYYYFVNWKSGVWQQMELRDGGGGQVAGTMVRTHDAGGQTEGCVADDIHQYYYIGEEPAGVWRYGAEPSAGTTRVQVDKTGSGGRLTADVEGISMYYKSDGNGYLIVSSQGASTFQVYERRPPSATQVNAFVGEFSVGSSGGIDAVSGTDGLDVTNFPLGPNYPQGLLVVHDAANSGGSASNHKLVPWNRVATALGLVSDTAWDPRLVGSDGSLPTPTPPIGQSPTPTHTPTPSRTPTPGPCSSTITNQGDANCDCTVSGVDYAIWLTNYRQSTGNGFRDGDFNGDGTVTGVDYAIWLGHYRQTCAGPSPTTPPGVTRTPTPAGSTPTLPPVVTGQGIWISPSEIARLPTSGSAWNAVLSVANGSWGTARLNDNNSMHDVYTLAGALVAARTGDNSMRSKTIAGLQSAMSSPISRTLELARGLQTYIIAADIIGYHDAGFENWVRDITFVRPVSGRDGSGLYNNALTDSTNWGGHERASAIAAALYLRDSRVNELTRAYREYIGENVSPKTLIYRGTNWIADQSNKAGVNRVGARIQGQDVSGVIPEDWRRGGEFKWPPTLSGYMWEGVQGFTVSAVLLHRAGLVTFTSGDNVLLRVLHQLMDPLNSPNPGINYQPVGDDTWIPWVVNYYAGTNFRTTAANPGKNMGWTDWTHAR